MSEYLDLVNAHDEVIGKKLRSEVYAEKLSNFRVVNAFLVNPQGQLWIPRRSATKSQFPQYLDMSMGGHVESGETYEQAFLRELAEELNIDAATVPWKLLGYLTPETDHVSSFMQVYEVAVEAAPLFNPRDFSEGFWLTPDELLERIDAQEPAKSDLGLLVRMFY